MQSISNAIIEDAGDPAHESLFTSETMDHQPSVTAQASQPTMCEVENSDDIPMITIEEFPWIVEDFSRIEESC